MDPELRRLLDKDQIRDVLYTYCRGIDRCDEELVRSVYHPGASDDHGTFSGTAEEFATWVIPVLLRDFAGTMHTLGNILIELDGDAAHVESYFNAYHRVPRPAGDRDLIVGGRYVDRFERRANVWKISARTVVLDWSRSEPATQPWTSVDRFKRGERSRADFVYRRSS
jgi:hypothetical protein